MTRKDYEAIAAILSRRNRTISAATCSDAARLQHKAEVSAIAADLADALAADNPRFDRERFLKACGAQ